MAKPTRENQLATKRGSRTYVPERGDLIWLSFNPQAGHEQAGRRPAVVLSPSMYNRGSGLALVVPVTSRIKGYPFEVALPAGLPVKGVALADQLKNLDWRNREASKIAQLPPEILKHIIQKASVLLLG